MLAARVTKPHQTTGSRVAGRGLGPASARHMTERKPEGTTGRRTDWDFSRVSVSDAGRAKEAPWSRTVFLPPVKLQAKLMVGATNDPLEQEADRAADRVLSMGEPTPAMSAGSVQMSRKCAACEMAEEETEHLQAKPSGSQVAAGPAPEAVHQTLRSAGERLEPSTRSFMETRFGADFSDVRVHAGAAAARSAREVNARAYTVGSDVVFAPGEYAPTRGDGRRLIAHELAHVVQQRQNRQPADSMLQRKPAASCGKTFSKTTTFTGLIDLVKAAEGKLAAAGVTAVDDQIKSLRSIYYGQDYSLDYQVEASKVRNLGFETYTHSLTNSPTDPTTILDCGLFQALKSSQDVSEGPRTVDFGHLLIALDARESVMDRIPFPSGGTGTEVVTWLGDLGGGAGSLAVARSTNPAINVSTRFKGTDYGAVSNLEGDVAGFLVGTASGATSVPSPTMPAGGHVSDALRDYLSPGKAGSAWKERAKNFLTIYGGSFDAAGNLANGPALATQFASKIGTFACQYLASRVAAGKLTAAQLQAATDHVTPCSEEMATTFVNTLATCAKSGGTLEAKGPFPSPKGKQPGACSLVQKGSGVANKAVELKDRAEGFLKDLHIPGL